MRIKICGITNLNDALLCSGEGADALGFIFTDKSPRYIDLLKAESIISRLSPFVLKVGIFVNETSTNVNRIAKQIGLNAVQLHGEETNEFIEKIELPVIKGFRVHNKFKYSSLKLYKNCFFLLDTYSGISPGGTGEIFNWNNIPKKIRPDIILAGGISSLNITAIFKEIKPGAVDLSSSLELIPGRKDPLKVKEFFKLVNKLRNAKC